MITSTNQPIPQAVFSSVSHLGVLSPGYSSPCAPPRPPSWWSPQDTVYTQLADLVPGSNQHDRPHKRPRHRWPPGPLYRTDILLQDKMIYDIRWDYFKWMGMRRDQICERNFSLHSLRGKCKENRSSWGHICLENDKTIHALSGQ